MIKNENILLSQTVSQMKGNIVSDMSGEKIMLSIEKGKYYNLGEIGGEIWDLIDEEISVKQLVDILTSRYDVEKSECEKQVVAFIEHLLKEDLIRVN